MRAREDIRSEFWSTNAKLPKHQMDLLLEALLDIRELLMREKE